MAEPNFVLPSFRVDGRLAAVTGASRGLGRAIAIGLAAAGADVAVTDIPSAIDECASTVQEVEALGRRSLVLPLDVRDPGSSAFVFVIAERDSLLSLVLGTSHCVLTSPCGASLSHCMEHPGRPP